MLRSFLIFLTVVPAIAMAQSTNIDLSSFVPSDAQLVAGAHVDAAKNSAFGQFLLAQIPAGDQHLQGFITETGIDPRSDISEVLLAWNGSPVPNAHWLIAAHGSFSASIETVEVLALKHGGTITRLPGVDLVSMPASKNDSHPANVCAGLFTDGFTNVAGDCTSVNSAVQFWSSSAVATPVVIKARELRAQQDLWFASVIPLAQFANFVAANQPAGVNLGNVLSTDLFKAVQQISGGVKFASGAQNPGALLSAEVLMDSPEDATSLLNVVNFITGLIQSGAAAAPAAPSLVALLGNLQISLDGSTLNIALNVPEATLEQLVSQAVKSALNPAAAPVV
jgi:hypothetical protein